MKNKLLTWIFENNFNFFVEMFRKKLSGSFLKSIEKDDLITLYETNKEFFEGLLIKDFIGYIPKSVNEPALKIFQEHAEAFQKWIMWQSYYINRKALHDPVRIPKYDGMMIYLKVLHLVAEDNKRDRPVIRDTEEKKVEIPWLDQALSGIDEYKKLYEKRQNATDTSEDAKDTEGTEA